MFYEAEATYSSFLKCFCVHHQPHGFVDHKHKTTRWYSTQKPSVLVMVFGWLFECLFEDISSRLHPQGKGGPQAILCGRRLKSSQKSENVPTKQIQKSTIFERSVVYCSWTFCSKKCVFDTSCGTLNKGKLKKWTVPKFQLIAPKKCVTGPCTQWQKSVRRTDGEPDYPWSFPRTEPNHQMVCWYALLLGVRGGILAYFGMAGDFPRRRSVRRT